MLCLQLFFSYQATYNDQIFFLQVKPTISFLVFLHYTIFVYILTAASPNPSDKTPDKFANMFVLPSQTGLAQPSNR